MSLIERCTTRVDASSVTVAPRRGGIITSLTLEGTELLYFDEETFLDSSRSVRGGIPILFPNAGSAGVRYPAIPSHGIARRSSHWRYKKLPHGFSEYFESDEQTVQDFPYAFALEVLGSFNQHIFGANDEAHAPTFSLLQTIRNTGMQPLPVACGLHPYIPVSHADKGRLRFVNAPPVETAQDADGRTLAVVGSTIEATASIWSNGGTISVRNPHTPIIMHIPRWGSLSFRASPEYEHFWIWSEPKKDFLCIEPVMRQENGLSDSPFLVAAGDTLRISLEISFDVAGDRAHPSS